MTTLQATEAQNTEGFWNFGDYQHKDDETFLQDAGRAAVLAKYTVVARQASDLKLVPLTDLNPALTAAKMVCGAIGGSAPDFAAISDAEFAVSVDGTLINITDLDLTGLDAEDDTAGYFTGGTNGAVIGSGWDAITDGTARFVINGVTIDLTGLDFSNAVTFDDVADSFNYALNGRATMLYDWKLNIFKLVSNKTGETSIVGTPADEGTGTDMTASGYLNMAAAGAATAGTGGEGLYQTIVDTINSQAAGRFLCAFDGDAFVFYSLKQGLPASVITVLTAVVAGAGTDISGASYLNGLTAVGTVTAATGQASTVIPVGIFIGDAILAADLVAGDVDDQYVAISGDPAGFDVDKLVLENSLDIDDIVQSTGQSIRQHLTNIGLIASATNEIFQTDPLT